MKNILEQLLDFLKKDERIFSEEGVLLKNKVAELVRKNDALLIKLLLSDNSIKQHFFFEVESTLIFDQEKFIRFIANKQFLPDSYTAFKNRIGLTVGNEYMSENREVVLVWPYKDCILEGGMTKEDQKREEIFYNETIAPDDINRLLDAKVFTNFKKIDKNGEQKLQEFKRDEEGTIKDNLIIKGNNLLVLASLKKQFSGKVKLIYIDPPYNTGNDSFKYNDRFNHSTWLTFMKNRLEIARELLRDDGVIFVQCDDNEQAYLKVLMDEVFGKENFMQTGVVNRASEIATANTIQMHEYFIVFSKNIYNFKVDVLVKYTISRGTVGNPNQTMPIIEFPKGLKCKGIKDGIYTHTRIIEGSYENIENMTPIIVENGVLKENIKLKARWRSSNDMRLFFANQCHPTKAKINGIIEEIYFENDRFNPQIKKRTFEKIPSLILNSKRGSKDLEELCINFDFPKSEFFIKTLISICTQKGDIVLDYHLGSGTTAAVAHKMDRRWIGVEQMDYIETVTKERLKIVIRGDQGGISQSVNWQGGGDFVTMELAQWNESWIEKIARATTGEELTNLWHQMKETAFLSYKVDPKRVDENATCFLDLSLNDQKRFLIECLDKNNLYVNLSEIDDTEYEISTEDIKLNKEFYKKIYK